MITQKDVEIKTIFHANGSLSWHQYFADGKISRHPGDGPANEVFNEKGQCVLRRYYVAGEINRNPADGPARESFSREKELLCSEY